MLNFISRNLLILLSITGIIGATLFSFATGVEKDTTANKLVTPPSSPFENVISGIGFIESSSRNINVGSFVPGIVDEIKVIEGDRIKKDEILFILDQRSAKAELALRKNNLQVTESALKLAFIELADRQDSFNRANGLASGRSISEEQLANRRFAVEKAKANIAIKQNMLSEAKSALAIVQVALDKTLVRSPIDGIVLKIRVASGEFISGNEQNFNSPILIGSDKPLYIRVQIDESDIWRFDKGAKAMAYLRSNKDINAPLSFVRLEPYAKSKEKIRGVGSELIDTRIIEIIYKIEAELESLFIGQQMDIFIESAKEM